jgi:hypothetical protein
MTSSTTQREVFEAAGKPLVEGILISCCCCCCSSSIDYVFLNRCTERV